MRRPPLVVLALVLAALLAVSLSAPAIAANSVHAPTSESVAADDLSVTIDTPNTVVANATHNYSVDVSDASGDVSATWDFAGTEKSGTDVQHAFAEAGNKTITVTVSDDTGESVTEKVTVDVVKYGDDGDDEGESPIDNIASIALLIFLLGGVPMILLLFVMPRAMEILTDQL